MRRDGEMLDGLPSSTARPPSFFQVLLLNGITAECAAEPGFSGRLCSSEEPDVPSEVSLEARQQYYAYVYNPNMNKPFIFSSYEHFPLIILELNGTKKRASGSFLLELGGVVVLAF